MLASLKSQLREHLADTFLWDLREQASQKRDVSRWNQEGRPVPPPDAIKRRILAAHGKAFQLQVLIETGTFLGGTIYALRDHFETLYSIELSEELAARARHRFRDYGQVHILQGDSGTLLPSLLREITVPCLLWLDGHYSAGITARGQLDTPIMEELRTVLGHPVKEHVILIDDARLFVGKDDYPTIAELQELIARERPEFTFSVRYDIIRIHPAGMVSTDL